MSNQSKTRPYTVPGRMDRTRTGYYIEGPGDGFDYSHGYLWPSFMQESKEQAERICKMVNEAYSQGYRHAQWEMRKALGIDK